MLAKVQKREKPVLRVGELEIDNVVYNIYGEMDSTAREAALQRRRETTAKVQKKERPDLRVRYGHCSPSY